MTQFTLIIGNKNYSSWSLRPWLAMKQFGVSFDEIRIPLYTPEASAQIKQYCPLGNAKVPILIHNSKAIWDSLAILDYLAQTVSDLPWCPNDPIARSIAAEMHSGFLALRNSMPMNCRADLPGKGINADVQRDIDRITTIWRTCRQTHKNAGDFLFGAFTIADAMYAPVMLRFRTYGVSLDPICQAYANALLALPALQEWLDAAQAEPETIDAFEL